MRILLKSTHFSHLNDTLCLLIYCPEMSHFFQEIKCLVMFHTQVFSLNLKREKDPCMSYFPKIIFPYFRLDQKLSVPNFFQVKTWLFSFSLHPGVSNLSSLTTRLHSGLLEFRPIIFCQWNIEKLFLETIRFWGVKEFIWGQNLVIIVKFIIILWSTFWIRHSWKLRNSILKYHKKRMFQ